MKRMSVLTLAVAILSLAVAVQAAPPKSSDQVVKVTAVADKPDAQGRQLVTITLAIDKDWHAYANPVGLDDLAEAQTTVTFTGPTPPADVKVEYPKGKLVKDPIGDYSVYEGKVTIKAQVKRAAGDTGPLQLSVKLQTCNEVRKICLQPTTIKLSVP